MGTLRLQIGLGSVERMGMREEDVDQRSVTTADATAADRPTADLARDLRAPLSPVERACCCPAPPAVRVILPSTSNRDHAVDLLMCAHHFRKASAALASTGAQTFDATGTLLCTGDRIAVG